MDTETLKLEKAKEELTRLVRERWDAEQKATLLSQAGVQLRKRDAWPIHGLTLLDLVRQHLPELQPIGWPDHPLIYGLVPADAALDNNLSVYFRRSSRSTEAPRFRPGFWTAFARPIENNFRRHFDPTRVVFTDRPKDSAPPTQYSLEILSDDVPPETAPERDGEIIKSIKRWAERHRTDPAQFAVTESKTPPARPQYTSVLDRMFSSLSARDLARIQMPLDIAAKLRRIRG